MTTAVQALHRTMTEFMSAAIKHRSKLTGLCVIINHHTALSGVATLSGTTTIPATYFEDRLSL